MNNPIYVENGILNQIKDFSWKAHSVPITKKSVFNSLMNEFKEFYEQYPYAIKWDYEKFIREILDYYS